MGAWIEIGVFGRFRRSWLVAPLMGAWIEITHLNKKLNSYTRRAPHGRVD